MFPQPNMSSNRALGVLKMKQPPRSLVVLVAVALLVFSLMMPSSRPVATAIVGVILALILPGYAITRAVMGSHVDPVLRTVLSVTLSIVSTMLAAALSVATAGEIARGPVTGCLGVVVVVAFGAAAARGHLEREIRLPTRPDEYRRAVVLGLPAALVSVAAVLAVLHVIHLPTPQDGFTELSVQPSGAQSKVVVHSRELVASGYRYRVMAGTRVLLSATVHLVPGETRTLALPAHVQSAVAVQLFREGSNVPYRQVTVPIVGPSISR